MFSPLEEVQLEWSPPAQLNCSAVVPRQPLGTDPATHLEFQLTYSLLDCKEDEVRKTDSGRVLIRLGTRAAEGGGGRLRASADVPPGTSPFVERSGLGLWKVLVRARLLWEKAAKGIFERGPPLESWIIIPCAEVSDGEASEQVRRGCLEVMQKSAREAKSNEQFSYQMVLKQLLMLWRQTSNGDEAAWLKCCGLDEDQAKVLLREWLVEPLAKYVDRLREFLSVGIEICDPPKSAPAALWEAWDSGRKEFDAWRSITGQARALPSANGDIGVALDQLPTELERLLAAALKSLDRPVQDPLACISSEVVKQHPDMELLWRVRGEARTALSQWGWFRHRIAALFDDGGAEAEISNRLHFAVNELRRGLPIAEEVLVKDLESRLEELRRTLSHMQQPSTDASNPSFYAGGVQAAVEYAENLLRPWSQNEENAPPFWAALLALASTQVNEAEGVLSAKDIWAVWANCFSALAAWESLRDSIAPVSSAAPLSPTAAAVSGQNARFRNLLGDLCVCLSQLLVKALHILKRSLNYPLLVVEEEFGANFGKVHIGGYEALQICMKQQPHISKMASAAPPTSDLGHFILDMANSLQEYVLADIRSTSKELEFATGDDTKEVAELIEALQSFDFDLTRWNFLRPCVAQMANGPGAVGEMMRRLLGLADRVRAARDLKDQQHLRRFTFREAVATVGTAMPSGTNGVARRTVQRSSTLGEELAAAVPSGTSAIPVATCSSLCPGQEITVAKEYHQVKSVSPLTLVTRTREDIYLGADVCRLETCPVIPAESGSNGWSQAFLDTVENFNSSLQDAAHDIVKRHYGWLPTDAKAREIALLTMYTVNSLYCEVNRALYDNDRQRLWDNAGYIRELRDIFVVGKTLHIVTPFIGGTALRSMNLALDELEAFAAQYERSQVVCWASFTSTSDAHVLKCRHDGNVQFHICCALMGRPEAGQHYPGLVKAFSAFPSEDEVIFPPHCPFRIVNVLFTEGGLTLEMETMEFPDMWEIIRNEDWVRFEAWASKNSGRIDCSQRKYSIIGAIAESVSKPLPSGVPDPFEVCVRNGADVNEFHNNQTPTGMLERRLGSAIGLDRSVYSDWLSSLRARGGKR